VTARPLAEVETIVARIGADQDLTATQRLIAQRDTWRQQAEATAARLRAVYRTLRLMHAELADGSAAQAVLADAVALVAGELLDRPGERELHAEAVSLT